MTSREDALTRPCPLISGYRTAHFSNSGGPLISSSLAFCDCLRLMLVLVVGPAFLGPPFQVPIKEITSPSWKPSEGCHSDNQQISFALVALYCSYLQYIQMQLIGQHHFFFCSAFFELLTLLLLCGSNFLVTS